MNNNESTFIYLSSNGTQVKQLKISKKKIIIGLVVLIAAVVTTAKFSLDFVLDITQNSRIESLKKNNEFLKTRLDEMNNIVENITSQVAQIEKKDDELRMIMGVKELDEDIRNVGIGGATFEYQLSDENINTEYSVEVSDYMNKIQKLDREVKLELSSYNDLINTYKTKEDSIRHMPALNPVLSGRITSKVGVRVHPVLKVRRHHEGIDIAAKKGTPIFAAADGVVKLARYNGGYGKCVYIDHIYGFETRYGHMDKILARVGQKVKRGDKIGLVGKTGLAKGPHLHYEVRYKNEILDPRQYYFDDLELNKSVANR
ncbi:MAG: M23 family metallopeptidase [Calditrichia bacterium]|nr:M23 family metallopeptidase [Calditrichia bacterium]